MTAIIVDDETQSHQVLRSLLAENHPDITVLSSAYSVQEGYEQVLEFQPDILFLDIEMPDGLGFDLLKKIKAPNFLVIFITAHKHYALKAIDFGAFDYLLKPPDKDRLQRALDKARNTVEKKTSLQQMDLLLKTLTEIQEKKLSMRISVSNMDGIYFFDVKDIIRLEAQHNYTLFRMNGSKKDYLASKNLGNYLSHFQPYPEFKQVHRSHLVNLPYVVKFVRSESYLLMKNDDKVPVSRNYRDDVMEGMSGI
ncbi:MAG: two-component system LytT family response regulator [Saprospiraceae bacterium]|jgi:two-component system LytT family response regulator